MYKPKWTTGWPPQAAPRPRWTWARRRACGASDGRINTSGCWWLIRWALLDSHKVTGDFSCVEMCLRLSNFNCWSFLGTSLPMWSGYDGYLEVPPWWKYALIIRNWDITTVSTGLCWCRWRFGKPKEMEWNQEKTLQMQWFCTKVRQHAEVNCFWWWTWSHYVGHLSWKTYPFVI